MNFFKQSVILLFLFFNCNNLFSQQNLWLNLSTSNSGLPTNTIRSVTQDLNGLYWIATWDAGLVKFDGKNWTVFDKSNSELPNNCVYSLAFDKKGNIYIGTMGGGLAIFDGKKKWKIFNQKNSEIPEDWIYSVALDKNSDLWVGTFSEGLGIFDGKNWKVYNKTNSILKDNKVTFIDIDLKSDNKILATQAELVFINDGKWKTEHDMMIDTLEGISYWISNTSDDRKIISYKFGSITLFDGKNFQIFKKENSSIPIEGFYSAVEDKKKIIWAGSFGEGVIGFDGSNWTHWNTKNSPLTNDLVFNVYVDQNNNKWFSTYFGGISIYNEDGVKLK